MTGIEIAILVGSIMSIMKGIDRKNEKYKMVKDKQKGWQDIR